MQPDALPGVDEGGEAIYAAGPASRERHMSSLLIRGGHLIDPTNGVDAVRDLVVRDGRIAAPVAGEAYDRDYFDASGCVVMAGGIDMHTHIGGGKVNLLAC